MPQRRNGQLDGAGPGVPLPATVAVTAVDPLLAALPIGGAAGCIGLGAHQPLEAPPPTQLSASLSVIAFP